MSIEETQELPAGWRWEKLGEVCQVVTGGTPPKESARFYGGTIPWIKPDNLDKATYVEASSEYLTEEGAAMARLLPPGSVLVSCIGNLGKLAIAKTTLATNQQINALVPGDKIDSEYLFFVCRTLQQQLKAAASVTIVPIVNKTSFSALKIPLPPLPEQKRIAAILTEKMAAVEKARAAAEARLKAAKELPEAYLREVFESKEALGWPIKKIGDFAKVQSGYAFKSEWFAETGIRLLRNANVFQGYLDWNDAVYLPEDRRHEFLSYELAEGDIVLSLDRPWYPMDSRFRG